MVVLGDKEGVRGMGVLLHTDMPAIKTGGENGLNHDGLLAFHLSGPV